MVASSALKDVQVAIHALITNDATLTNVRGITGVFDEAPADQAYPYITLGTKIELPWSERTFGRREKDVTLVLDIWTGLNDGDGHLDILDDLNRLFDDPVIPLPLVEYTNTKCVVEWTTTIIDESDQCRHSIVRLRTINT